MNIVHPIPLVKPDPVDPVKGEYTTLKLRADPADAQSPTREIQIAYFQEGTVEQWLEFLTALRAVFQGQALTTGPQRYSMTRTLLKGDPLTFFNQKATEIGNETVANYEKVLKFLTYHIVSRRAVRFQQRYMLHSMRKPDNMSMLKFVTRVTQMNEYLSQLPNDRFDDDGIPAGFNHDQKIPDAMLLDAIFFGLPVSWQKEMTRQGFEYLDKPDPKGELVQFCTERIEVLEKEQPLAKKARANAKSVAKNKTAPKAQTDGSNKTKFDPNKTCKLHGTGHDSSECRILARQAAEEAKKKDVFKSFVKDPKVVGMMNTFICHHLANMMPKPIDKKRRQVQWDAPSHKKARKQVAALAPIEVDSDDEAEDEAMQSFGALQLHSPEDSKPEATKEYSQDDSKSEEDQEFDLDEFFAGLK